jgi:hypothetical protein
VGAKCLKRACAILTASVACAGTSSPALAQSCTPEQTVAVLDQYCEVLPTAGGAVQPTAPQPASGSPLAAMLPRRTVRRLRRSGAAATALLEVTVPTLVASNPAATARERRTGRMARDRVARGTLDAPKGTVKSLASGVATGVATAGGSVVGDTFRWGLVICTLGLAGMSWFRFRAGLRL